MDVFFCSPNHLLGFFVVSRQLEDEVPQKTAGIFGVKGNKMQMDAMLGWHLKSEVLDFWEKGCS